MSMKIKTSELDSWVKEVDAVGGIWSKQSFELQTSFVLEYDTHVDKSLDPFSDEYFNQMTALHKEIYGKDIDQHVSEQYEFSFDQSLNGYNPYGSKDIRFISKHVHAASRLIKTLDLEPSAEICDLGSGWGLTSEIFSYCGAKVTAVDINKKYIELNTKRFNRFGYDSTAIHSGFDDINIDKKFDAVVFYESLHHSLRPWETIAKVKTLLKDSTGKIAISGEPIGTVWWPNWGIRLDAESVYVMHKFGWFESGWSKEFITSCFEMNDLSVAAHNTLEPHPGDIVLVATQK